MNRSGWFLRKTWTGTVAALIAGSLLLHGGPVAAEEQAVRPPNVLLIIADDLTYSDLPLYGGVNVRTPNLDRLATEGMVFDRAFVEMSMCVPSRAALYTGLYPFRNGAAWNHSPCRDGTESVVHRLREQGYRVGLAGKKHVYPDASFPFEHVPGVDGRSTSEHNPYNPEGIRRFIRRDPAQPFLLVIASTLPHVPWTHGDPAAFDPQQLRLPPYFADTPQTRQDYARYLAEIVFLDERVGLFLKELEDSGQAGDTLVLFTSEQGAQWPGAKWTLWTEGVQTGLIARWPGRIAPGTRTRALVQYVDVLPTLLELAGGDPGRQNLDGRSFAAVLAGVRDTHRDYAFFLHNNVPEGPPYPIRGVTDGIHLYLRNLVPDQLYIEKHIMGRPAHNPYWATWMFAAADHAHAEAMVQRYMRRPAEELYHLGSDPFQLRNLAGNPAVAEHQHRLSAELDRWMTAQGDPGAALDTRQSYNAARQGRHPPLPQTNTP